MDDFGIEISIAFKAIDVGLGTVRSEARRSFSKRRQAGAWWTTPRKSNHYVITKGLDTRSLAMTKIIKKLVPVPGDIEEPVRRASLPASKIQIMLERIHLRGSNVRIGV